MNTLEKKAAWRDPAVAGAYDRRRFHGRLDRRKHRHDEALVLGLLARVPAVRRVLDLPFGTGRLLPALARGGYRVLGLDISRAMLAARPSDDLSAPALVGLLQGDAEALPLATDAVDAVVALRFLFHFQDPKVRVRMLSEMARVSRQAVVGQVRYRWNVKHLGRWARSRAGLARKYRPSQNARDIECELAAAGLELQELVPVSRLFSDKALFLARPCAHTPRGH